MIKNNPFREALTNAAATAGRRPENQPVQERRRPAITPAPEFAPTASPRQVALIETLWEERQITAETRPSWVARLEQLVTPEARAALAPTAASAFIDYLFTLPRLTAPVTEGDMIPAGRYAVEVRGGLVFAHIDRPTEGKWAGWTFVSQQAGDETHRVNRGFAEDIKAAIRKVGFKEASIRYGRELGHCGVCGRTLTNEASRAAGIGPKCAASF